MERLLAAIDQREEDASISRTSTASPSSSWIPSSNFHHEHSHVHDLSGSDATATAGGGIAWQEMFQQLKDFHELKHRRIPPRLARWVNAQRRQYKMYGIGLKQPAGIITNRIRQLNSIGFEWNGVVSNDCAHSSLPPPPPPTSSQSKGSPYPLHQRGILSRPTDHPFTDAKLHLLRKSAVNTATTTKSNWTDQEDETILRLQKKWGNKWRKISTELNTGRTENGVKNRWIALDRLRRRCMNDDSTDDEAGGCIEMDFESDDEGMMEEAEEEGDAGNGEDDVEQENDDIYVEEESSEFIEDRTDHVQRLVRYALEREKRPRGALKSTAAVPKKSSRRVRKPSRRVQESYLPFGSNSSSCNSPESGEGTMQPDVRDIECINSWHENENENSSRGPNDSSQESYKSDTVLTSTREQFPETLFRMVNTCSQMEPHVIEWVLDGTAFQVKDVSLIPAVLHRYFRHKNYVSLNRMLHLYGFQRHTSGKQFVDEFHHPHFTRWSSRESLVANVTKCEGVLRYGHESRSKGNGDSSTQRSRGHTVTLKTSSVTVGEGCGKGFNSNSLLMSNLPRPTITTEGTYAVTSNDVVMSLRNRKYKQVMFAYFKKLGLKDGADDVEKLKKIGGEIINTFKRGMGDTGRFYRKVRGTGSAEGKPLYELQDDCSTLSRIASDLRRRMESANYWLELLPETQDQAVEEMGMTSDTKSNAILSMKEKESLELTVRSNSRPTDAEYENDDDGDDGDDDDGNFESNIKCDDEDKSKTSTADVSTLSPCMCKKSKCLKLYCECFNKEQYCSGCFCIDCNNTPHHNTVRERAIADIKQRNPGAFIPRIKTSIECKCKRTACLKKYCDCFLHGVYCTDTCQCSMCKNVAPQRHNPQPKSALVFKEPAKSHGKGSAHGLEHQSAKPRPTRSAKVGSTASKLSNVTPSPKSKPRVGDIILSLKNDEYKEIMFAKFRMMGKRLGSGENAVLELAKHELFSVFKKIMGKDGRFLRSDRHLNDLWVADDDEAIHKIKSDLKRRNESIKHWLIE